jgi:hypothetical protein
VVCDDDERSVLASCEQGIKQGFFCIGVEGGKGFVDEHDRGVGGKHACQSDAVSFSAGAYVCNDVYWALLSSEVDFGHRGLFIHVPGEDVVSVEDMARAITLCIETALNS